MRGPNNQRKRRKNKHTGENKKGKNRTVNDQTWVYARTKWVHLRSQEKWMYGKEHVIITGGDD